MCLRRSQCVFIFSNQPIEPVDLISRRKKNKTLSRHRKVAKFKRMFSQPTLNLKKETHHTAPPHEIATDVSPRY